MCRERYANPATGEGGVYASGSERQNTRNVLGRRYLSGAKFWRNRYKSNSDRARSRAVGRNWRRARLTLFADRDRARQAER